MIRVLIVDDERPARDGLRLRLEQMDGFEVVAEAASGQAAIQAVDHHAPDLMLLDIRMPDLNGFEVLKRIPAARRPRVIFVTAHDRHAVRAFEMEALDYLLKPITQRRLDEALERVRKDRAHSLASATLEALARQLRNGDDTPADAAPPRGGSGASDTIDRITVRDGARFRVVPVTEIRWFESCGNYVTLHTAGKDLLHRVTLAELERRLPPREFARIHRGAIVNVREVAEIRPSPHGDYEVLMRDGALLRMSRRYRDGLL